MNTVSRELVIGLQGVTVIPCDESLSVLMRGAITRSGGCELLVFEIQEVGRHVVAGESVVDYSLLCRRRDDYSREYPGDDHNLSLGEEDWQSGTGETILVPWCWATKGRPAFTVDILYSAFRCGDF